MGNNSSRRHNKNNHHEFTFIDPPGYQQTNRSHNAILDQTKQTNSRPVITYDPRNPINNSNTSIPASHQSEISLSNNHPLPIIYSPLTESQNNSTQIITCPIISSEKSIIQVPGFPFKYTRECDFITETSCCICFEDYFPGMIMHMLPCNHILHNICLQAWYNKSQTCPMCRATHQ
jgi:hypothetical protein